MKEIQSKKNTFIKEIKKLTQKNIGHKPIAI